MHERNDYWPARPADRGRLRASRADREQVIDTLKDAFVQDRLTKDEFDARVAGALASRTHADLAALTADLPASPAAAPPPRRPVPARPRRPEPRRPENVAARRGTRVLAVTTVLAGGTWAAAWLSQADSQVLAVLVWTLTIVWAGSVILVGSVLLESRSQRRSAGRLPREGRPRLSPS
jgi:Domain of unknown function (DUF1707)